MKSLSFRDLLKVTGNFMEVEAASSSYRFFSKRQLVERALARIVQPSGSCNGGWQLCVMGGRSVGRGKCGQTDRTVMYAYTEREPAVGRMP